MSKFHTLKISDIRRETDECVSITLAVPDYLKNIFGYKAGQYITLKLNYNGNELRRSYSLCSSPQVDKEVRIAVKKIKDGKASSYLNTQIRAGGEIEALPPMGNFCIDVKPDFNKHFIAFAAGSGITPVFSIIKSVLHLAPASRVTLFYSNKSRASVIFYDLLLELQEKNKGRFKVVHIFTAEQPHVETRLITSLHGGRITPAKVYNLMQQYVVRTESDEYLLCGPEEMMNNVLETLMRMQIQRKNIHLEHFTSVTVANTDAYSPDESTNGSGSTGMNTTCEATIILDGNTTKIKMGMENVILDAAIEAGLDVPYSCTGGMCSTCRAKLIEGKVRMEKNFALTDTEVEQGFILTCQSHPVTSSIVVDYDSGC